MTKLHITEKTNEKQIAECVGYFRQNSIWERLFEGFKDKYSSYGRFSGKIVIKNLKEDDIEELEGFFGHNFHGQKSVTVSAEKFTRALQSSKYRNLSPDDILEAYFGEPMLGKAEIREKYEEKRSAIIKAFTKEFERTPSAYVFEKIDAVIKNSDLDKWKSLLWFGARLYNNLPYRSGQKMYLAVFAARMTGNPHAFDQGTIEGKLLYEIVQIDLQQHNIMVEPSKLFPAYKRQKSYLLAGIMIDDISNYAMLYRVHAVKKDGQLHRGIEGFSQEMDIMQLPLNVLAELEYLECVDEEIYIVENPSMFAMLCGKKSCMCMNGQPRLAGLMVLELLARTGTHVYYSGDLDPEGILIAQKLSQFYKGCFDYWHMAKADYKQSKSKEVLSERRIKMLDKISDERLMPVVDEIRKAKVAGYQENYAKNLL